ncbi:hypothetical protein AB0N62_37305 [Streptomyces sp. NPDC093982]|uniref:hypothetical protein n=1 Tax=Streptomyces sp. NPDC093982 TaxID=3155077 RepID=UPI003440CE27
MSSRNLFKFVSVRPPVPAVSDDACRLVNKEAGSAFVKDVEDWRQGHTGKSLQQARRTVSVEFLKSPQYFARNDIWKDLRPLRRNLQDYLARLCRPEGKKGDPETAQQETAAAALGEQARVWLDPERFAAAKSVLWRSYYANALAPEVRPGDRPEMLDWIRVLAALERLRPPPDEADWRYDPEGCACVARLSRARVNLPHELFTDAPEPTPVPQRPEDSIEEDIARLRDSLAGLLGARRNLDRFYRRRIGRLRLEPRPGDDDVTVGPPWLLTEEDADPLRDVVAELNRLGTPFDGSLVPHVVQVLDEAIASDTAALAVLESRVEVQGIGAMALARRTVRGLRAPGQDQDHDQEGTQS